MNGYTTSAQAEALKLSVQFAVACYLEHATTELTNEKLAEKIWNRHGFQQQAAVVGVNLANFQEWVNEELAR